MKQKLLLHVCCGPCSLYVLQKLQADFAVSGFFYNPNIQPFREYEFRRLELAKIAEKFAWPMVYAAYDMREWFAAIRGLEREPERGRRCPVCFRFRLEKAFLYAREHGFDVVASTLSISPYKVTAQINEQGLAAGPKSTASPFCRKISKKMTAFQLPPRRRRRWGSSTRITAAASIPKRKGCCACANDRRARRLFLPKRFAFAVPIW